MTIETWHLVPAFFAGVAACALSRKGERMAKCDDLKARVKELEAEVCRLRADDWQVSRILAWLENPDRKPSELAFTHGKERETAFWIEVLMGERDQYWTRLEAAREAITGLEVSLGETRLALENRCAELSRLRDEKEDVKNRNRQLRAERDAALARVKKLEGPPLTARDPDPGGRP